MTKEELEKEVAEKAALYFDSLDVDHGNVSDTPFSGYDVFVAYKRGALDFALPREKEIKTLCERCLQLQKDKGNLTDRVRELENKIRFMGQQIVSLKVIARYDQFAKAKELLERLLITSCNSDVLNLLPNCSEVLKVRAEAEQFISEVSK